MVSVASTSATVVTALGPPLTASHAPSDELSPSHASLLKAPKDEYECKMRTWYDYGDASVQCDMRRLNMGICV